MQTILYLLFVHVTLLIPGYVIIKKAGLFSKNKGIQLVGGYGTTIVLYGLLATLTYILGFPRIITAAVTWIILLVSFYFLIRQKLYKDLWFMRFPLICLVLLSIVSTIFVGLTYGKSYQYIPDPEVLSGRNYQTLNTKVMNIALTPADDNYIPYRQAQFFVNRSDPAKDSFISEWGVHFFQRTPLMGAVTANYFTMLGDRPPINYTWIADTSDADNTYLKFQLIAHVMNSLFIVPAFFLLIRLFDKKTAQITSLFILISPFFIYAIIYSWPKSLVAFFILLSWLLLLEKKMSSTLWAAGVSGVAYLTHDLAVLYIGASALLLLQGRRFKELFAFVPLSLVFALPWLFVSNILYHRGSTFIYYPLETRGIPQPNQGKEIINHFLNLSPLHFIKIKVLNFLYLFSPYQLLTSEGGQQIPARIWGLNLFSVSGSVGLGLMIPMVLAIYKKIKDITLWILVATPVILSLIIIGWPKGLGSMHFAQAVIVLLMGVTVSYLLTVKNKIWLMAAFAVNTVQLIFYVIYSYKYGIDAWLNIRDILSLLIWLSIIGFCVYTIHLVSTKKKSTFAQKIGL